MKTNKGKFYPTNPEKYKGDPTNIIFRSGWEKTLMEYLDNHPDVIEWESENFFIPYTCPVTRRTRRYFPDFKVKMRTKAGLIETRILEVKPFKQTQIPDKRGSKYRERVITYLTNQAKWEAAQKYCDNRDYKFQLITENELFDKRK